MVCSRTTTRPGRHAAPNAGESGPGAGGCGLDVAPRRGRVPRGERTQPRRGRTCPACAGTNLARAAPGVDGRGLGMARGRWGTRPKWVRLSGAGGRGLAVARGRW
jgi:hypothetical protein